MIRVLFVCTGNICRSPTAEGILRARLVQAGLDRQVSVNSAGTHAYHCGDPPDRRSIAASRRHGIDISPLLARKVVPEDFSAFHHIVAMDGGHADHLRKLCPPELRRRIRLLMSFVADSVEEDVPDPYYGGDDGFEQVFRMIERGVGGLLNELTGTTRTLP